MAALRRFSPKVSKPTTSNWLKPDQYCLRQISKNKKDKVAPVWCPECVDFDLKFAKNRLVAGLHPNHPGKLTALPRPLIVFGEGKCGEREEWMRWWERERGEGNGIGNGEFRGGEREIGKTVEERNGEGNRESGQKKSREVGKKRTFHITFWANLTLTDMQRKPTITIAGPTLWRAS